MKRGTTRPKARPKHPPPLAQQFGGRLAALRALIGHDPAEAGDQAIKLLEEYLESLAQTHGYQGEGSMGRYAMFLRGRSGLAEEMLDQADAYTQVRNCLAHTYGLQVSPALAAELLDFAEQLIGGGSVTAAQLMTRDVRSVAATERLVVARDLMVRGGYGRLPVLRDGDGIAGLLAERDVMVAQAQAERAGRTIDALKVADALPEDAAERVALASPDASRDQVVELLRQPGVLACLITPGGRRDERPVGIVTAADLLGRV
ncbi:MAG TPA: CBS domain-containing protein [Roseiflexaceae bacterium]|nr:CBS domain-containing protein [Roseiflexaceae bacterium]